MKFMIKAVLPTEKTTMDLKSPKFQQKIGSVMEDIKPETVYFCLDGGHRVLYMIVTINESHELPRVAEPLWQGFGAHVEFIPVMDKEAFARAQPTIEAISKKY